MTSPSTASAHLDEPSRDRITIVAIGGSVRPDSSSERAMRVALGRTAELGAETVEFGAADLSRLPLYTPDRPEPSPLEQELVAAVRDADGLIVATPGYHGGISGLIKNALDHLEDLRQDRRPYLDGRAIGCIVTAYGWQACGTTLVSLRSTVHALRGWPTPFGATVNSSEAIFDADGGCADARVAAQLRTVGEQVMEFARPRVRHEAAAR